MKKQTCQSCGSEWASNIMSKQCPFCGNNLNNDIGISNSIGRILDFIISNRGIDVLVDKRVVISYIMDIFSGDEKDKKLFKIACDNGILEYVKRIYLSTDSNQKNILINKAINILEEKAFLSHENSMHIINMIFNNEEASFYGCDSANVVCDDKIENSLKNEVEICSFLDGDIYKRNEYGNKGIMLCKLSQKGFPVPQGFIIDASECNKYFDNGKILSTYTKKEINNQIRKLEAISGKELGNPENPLFLSVRCSPKCEIQGLKEAIKCIGINDEVVDGITKRTKSIWALDTYFNFIIDFSYEFDIIKKYFDSVISNYNAKKEKNELSIDFLKECCELSKKIFFDIVGKEFPQDPIEQLHIALSAAYSSWNAPIPIVYRRENEIPSNWGMALIVQELVFGNFDLDSGTGKCIVKNDLEEPETFYQMHSLKIDCSAKNSDDIPECHKRIIRLLIDRYRKDIYIEEYTIELDFVIQRDFLYIVGCKIK